MDRARMLSAPSPGPSPQRVGSLGGLPEATREGTLRRTLTGLIGGTLVLLGLVVLLPGCETTTETTPYHGDGAVVLRSVATQRWSVRVDGREVGSVVRYEEPGTERFFLMVRNAHGQDLGVVDSKGRAWRNRAFAEPELVGSGTVLEGACRILDLADGARLVETALQGPSRD